MCKHSPCYNAFVVEAIWRYCKEIDEHPTIEHAFIADRVFRDFIIDARKLFTPDNVQQELYSTRIEPEELTFDELPEDKK